MSGLVIHSDGRNRYLLVTTQLLTLLEDAKNALGLASQHPAFGNHDQSGMYQQYLVLRELLRKL